MILETLFPITTIGTINSQYVFIYCSELRYFYISTQFAYLNSDFIFIATKEIH